MIRNLIKLSILGGVILCALNVSSRTINEMVIQVHAREKTIADAIIKQQVQDMFKEVEKEIEKVQEETQIEIKKEEVVMKEPIPEKPKKKEVVKKVVEAKEEVPQDSAQDSARVVTEEPIEGIPTQEVPEIASDAVLDITTYSALSEENMIYIGDYLIEHYFLFGQVYYQNETDPLRYERKKLVSDMEDQVITSLDEGLSLIKDFKGLDANKLEPIIENTQILAEAFKQDYKDSVAKGEEIENVYNSVNDFFDTYLKALNKAQTTFTLLEDTTNKALILPMFFKSINQDLLPSIKEVLNQGFSLKEQTNKIYVEGLDASFLIMPEEVMVVIENPYSILPPKTIETEVTTSVEESEIEKNKHEN